MANHEHTTGTTSESTRRHDVGRRAVFALGGAFASVGLTAGAAASVTDIAASPAHPDAQLIVVCAEGEAAHNRLMAAERLLKAMHKDDRGQKAARTESDKFFDEFCDACLGVLERLPHEALADLAERLIDRLDVAGLDPDLEPEVDCCSAGEDGGLPISGDRLPGDADDAEPDDEDVGVEADGPRFPRLRAERDGFLTVERRPVVIVIYRGGKPVRVQSVRWERRA